MIRAHNSTRRSSTRYQAEIPIEISATEGHLAKQTGATHDISHGGLSFISEIPYTLNQKIKLAIQITQPYFEEVAKVIWCLPNGSDHEIGVQFINNEAIYRIKMLEQVRHIEQYRRDMKSQHGRDLSPQEAALEWITKYAGKFREQY